MAATAVGLFADASVAEAVVDALRAHGMPMKGIRIVTGPGGNSDGSGEFDAMARVQLDPDFAKALLKELRAMGASETESLAYVEGVHEGNALVFMTASLHQADAASAIMNQYTPYDLEDNPNDRAIPPAVHQARPENEGNRTRQKGDGARLFSW
jgi:hypothetical protein